MKQEGLAYKGIATLLILTMGFHPVLASAQQWTSPPSAPPEQVGREAQAFGGGIAPSDIGSFDDGTITFPGGGGISTKDLFPGQQPGQDASRFFPHANTQSSLESIHSSDSLMQEYGENAHSSLYADMVSDNPSIQGDVYSVLTGALNRSRPDFSNDPVLDTSRDTYENIDLDAFGDCQIEHDYTPGTIDAHIPDYYQCTRVIDDTNDCRIEDRYINVYTDTQRVLRFRGNVDHTIRLTARVATPEPVSYAGSGKRPALHSAVDRVGGYYRESNETNHGDLTANIWYDTVALNLLQDSIDHRLADMQMSLRWNGSVQSVSIRQRPNAGNNWTLIIDIYTPASGEQRVDLSFEMAMTYVGEAETLTCGITSTGFCESGEFICTDSAQRTINGIAITNSRFRDAIPPIAPGYDGPICYAGYRHTNCEFYKGDMDCWTDPEGNLQCHENEGGELNTCTQYEDNPECGFIKSECVDGAKGVGGECYVFTDTYDCGETVAVPTLEKESSYQCGGPIRCMGSDCLDINLTESGDFARASALLNAAQFMGQDMDCGTEGGECTVFGGDAGECKEAVGGVVDCCEKPSNISLADYIKLIMSVPKIDSAIMSLDGTMLEGFKGSYQLLRDPALSGWSEVTKPFTTYMEGITGYVDTFKTTANEFAMEAVGKLKQGISNITGNTLSNAASSGGGGAAVPPGAAESFTEAMLGPQGAQVFSYISTAYTIYVVTMMAIQMIWSCEQSEFEMNAQRALKNCTYVGSYCKTEVFGVCVEKRESYCCFNSPLARIIHEQGRPTLGMGWGSAESPQCDGLSPEQLAEIDWDRVNLDEWLGILQSTGMFPDPNNLDLTNLTGAGNPFNIDGDRLSAGDRTLERLEGIDVDALRQDAANQIQATHGP